MEPSVFDPMSFLPYVVPSLLSGCGGWIAAQRMARSNETIASLARADKDRAERIEAAHDHADDLTSRFRILMDGYEARIRDLTAEVAGLKVRVEEMSAQLKRCARCPYFPPEAQNAFNSD